MCTFPRANLFPRVCLVTSSAISSADSSHCRNPQVHDVFFSNGAGLRKDWEQAWAHLQVQLEPLIQDRAVVGFFLGDELFPGYVSQLHKRATNCFPSLNPFS